MVITKKEQNKYYKLNAFRPIIEQMLNTYTVLFINMLFHHVLIYLRKWDAGAWVHAFDTKTLLYMKLPSFPSFPRLCILNVNAVDHNFNPELYGLSMSVWVWPVLVHNVKDFWLLCPVMCNKKETFLKFVYRLSNNAGSGLTYAKTHSIRGGGICYINIVCWRVTEVTSMILVWSGVFWKNVSFFSLFHQKQNIFVGVSYFHNIFVWDRFLRSLMELGRESQVSEILGGTDPRIANCLMARECSRHQFKSLGLNLTEIGLQHGCPTS